MPLGQGGQDADHHLMGTDFAGRCLRVVERAPQAVLEGGEPTRAQGRRGHVDLDVELAELGLEVRLRDPLQHLGVLERWVPAVVDEALALGVRGFLGITAHIDLANGEPGLERRLADRIRRAGARIVGPNCLGIANTDPHDLARTATVTASTTSTDLSTGPATDVHQLETDVGVIVPVDRGLIEEVLAEVLPRVRGSPDQVANDRRFATAVYRRAVARGLMARVGSEEAPPPTG